jgi:hypothetical protein
MVDDAHAMGHLVMPFFSPGHWSLGSPSTDTVGEGVASRKKDGKPRIYDGSPHYGRNYYVTPWNRHVIPKAVENLKQFKQFGCDAAFADIVGNAHFPWDLNPASPNPRAYFTGMIRMGEAMAKVLPVTTEGGDDLHARNFWGMFQFFLKMKYKFTGHFPWKTKDGWGDRWQPGIMRLYPYNSALVSGLSVIYSHNLGPPILEMEMLADNLAMGMGQYMTFEQTYRGNYGRLDWLRYLHFLQQEVVQHYFGKRMTGFKYVVGFDDVSLTQWPGMDLYVSHVDRPVAFQVKGKTHELGSFEMLRVLNGEAKAISGFEEWKRLQVKAKP